MTTVKVSSMNGARRIRDLGGIIISDGRGTCPSGPTGGIEVKLPDHAELVRTKNLGVSDGPWVYKSYKITHNGSINYIEFFTGNASTTPYINEWYSSGVKMQRTGAIVEFYRHDEIIKYIEFTTVKRAAEFWNLYHADAGLFFIYNLNEVEDKFPGWLNYCNNCQS